MKRFLFPMVTSALFLALNVRAQNLPKEETFSGKLWFANVMDVTQIIKSTADTEKDGRLVAMAFEFGRFFDRRLNVTFHETILVPSIPQSGFAEGDTLYVMDALHIVGNKLMNLSGMFRGGEEGKVLRSKNAEAQLTAVFRKEMITIASLIANSYRKFKPHDVERMYTSLEDRAGLNADERKLLRIELSSSDLKSFNEGMNDIFKGMK